MRRVLAGELEEAFELIDADTLTPQIVAELAEDLGVPKVNVYAEGGLRMFAEGTTTPSLSVAPNGDRRARHQGVSPAR